MFYHSNIQGARTGSICEMGSTAAWEVEEVEELGEEEGEEEDGEKGEEGEVEEGKGRRRWSRENGGREVGRGEEGGGRGKRLLKPKHLGKHLSPAYFSHCSLSNVSYEPHRDEEVARSKGAQCLTSSEDQMAGSSLTHDYSLSKDRVIRGTLTLLKSAAGFQKLRGHNAEREEGTPVTPEPRLSLNQATSQTQNNVLTAQASTLQFHEVGFSGYYWYHR